MDFIPFENWEIDRQKALQSDIPIPAHKAGQAIHNLNLKPYLKNILSPTLTIFGQQDGTVPVADGYLIEKHIPDGQLVLINECGHFPMYEKPTEYLDALHRFF